MGWILFSEGAWVGYLTAIERFGCELSGLFDEKYSTNQGAGTVDCIDQDAS